MSREAIEVLLPGALTTVQDLGRPGHQSVGVTPGGVMDTFAMSIANILAGNDAALPVLEITLLGPHIRFLADTIIAIAGADLTATVGARLLSPWSSAFVMAGDVLTFKGRRDGVRAYLAVHGALDVPLVLGSFSTDLKTQIGGLFGRKLKADDILSVRESASRNLARFGGRLIRELDIKELRPAGEPIRFIRRSLTRHTSNQQVSAFKNGHYHIRPDSDRMGIKLGGAQILENASDDAQGLSEPVTVGTIQLPPSGTPIVLMADRQTVGGYPKLGTVITVDIGRLAQVAPGDDVRFAEVTLEKAQALLAAEQKFLKLLSLCNL